MLSGRTRSIATQSPRSGTLGDPRQRRLVVEQIGEGRTHVCQQRDAPARVLLGAVEPRAFERLCAFVAEREDQLLLGRRETGAAPRSS